MPNFRNWADEIPNKRKKNVIKEKIESNIKIMPKETSSQNSIINIKNPLGKLQPLTLPIFDNSKDGIKIRDFCN